MKASELRAQSEKELQALLQENKALLADLQYNHSLNPVENPARIQGIRKDIARILTVQKQQQAATETSIAK